MKKLAKGFFALTGIFLFMGLLCFFVISYFHLKNIEDLGYVPLKEAMLSANYKEEKKNSFTEKRLAYTVTFDFKKNKATKDLFAFDISDKWLMYKKDYYVKKNIVKKL